MSKNDLDGYVASLRALAVRSLRRMYVPEERVFIFCLRRGEDGAVRPEGRSRRYTAITIVGLALEEAVTVHEVLGDHSLSSVYDKLLETVSTETNLGDVALTHWAGTAIDHPGRAKALARLLELAPAEGAHHTVELAWVVTALSLDPERPAPELRDAVANRLIASQNESIFPHVVGGTGGLRAHVACFADLVYPIQALAHHARATGNDKSLASARACGEYICREQGPAGQWWWHYDHRTGKVIEGYPVYAVHQDAMAPMALFDLQRATGQSYDAGIRRGLEWLARSPEIGGASLVDSQADLIWRKVARKEPKKLARSIQAVASGIHPELRAPGLDALLPPGAIDHEDRPYHLGWLLYAFPPERASWS